MRGAGAPPSARGAGGGRALERDERRLHHGRRGAAPPPEVSASDQRDAGRRGGAGDARARSPERCRHQGRRAGVARGDPRACRRGRRGRLDGAQQRADPLPRRRRSSRDPGCRTSSPSNQDAAEACVPSRASARRRAGSSTARPVDRRDDAAARAVQARGDRRLRRPERAPRLAVGEADDVDRDEREAEIVGQLGDRAVERLGLDRLLGPRRPSAVGELELLDARRHLRAPRRGAARAQERVAQHPHQVGELVVAAQHARPREHAGEGLLHEVLGVVRRAAQRPRRAVQTVDMPRQRLRVKPRHGCSTHASRRSRAS